MTKPIVGTVEIIPTPEQLATCFWSMDGDQQAVFFNCLGTMAHVKLAFQLEYVRQSKELDDTGKNAMWDIGCYGEEARRG